MSARVAIIDSGVNPRHPHVGAVAGGVSVTAEGIGTDYLDRLGHGTAVAGAIREKSSRAEIFAVKVFERSLATTGNVLFRALDWCLDQEMTFINLSLGTLNQQYLAGFQERVGRAREVGVTIVSAYLMNEQRALPGSLPGVAGVVLDEACGRHEFREQQMNGQTVYAACGYPREIPGIPRERNLQGISFAVANVTGLLAAKIDDDL
jgi:subtilisin family serine protease